MRPTKQSGSLSPRAICVPVVSLTRATTSTLMSWVNREGGRREGGRKEEDERRERDMYRGREEGGRKEGGREGGRGEGHVRVYEQVYTIMLT